jgi:hypothetical protein
MSVKIEFVIIPKEIVEKATEYAKKVESTNNYSDTNQSDINKKIEDNIAGKIGEEAVRQLLLIKGKDVSEVDYKIYDFKEKSWESDLTVRNKNGEKTEIAVKTQRQSAAERFGLSWTFQYSPKTNYHKERIDPVLKKQDAYVYFVQMLDGKVREDGGVEVWIYPVKQIKNCIFGEPKLQRLKGKKKVVYANKNFDI